MATRHRHRDVPHVALIIETSLSYGRGLLRGVARYVRENGPWSVYLEQRSLYDPAPPWLKSWKGDGIISRASYRQIARLVVDAGVPTVDLNEEVTGLGLPLIWNDHRRIGELAAEHLIERGFTHFGFFGYANLEWSNSRLKGFQAEVIRRGLHCAEYASAIKGAIGSRLPRWEEEIEHAARWIAQLPKPAGVMAANDYRAVQLLDACRRAKVAVPDQVAVIGVDDEDVACELANPPLTSIVPDAERIGYEAAKLLDIMMKGKRIPTHEQFIPPRGLVPRQSTDVTAIADPHVAQAMHFIRKHACDGISVNDVLDEVPVSRSVLQRRFRGMLGRSIHDVIRAVRLERVKMFLMQTDLSLYDIAQRTGFKHSEYLSSVFRQQTGQTISQFRQSPRGG